MDALLLPRRYTFVERPSRRVALAVDRVTGLDVAVKASHLVAGPGFPGGDGAAELAREAELLATLAHPAFPRVLDFGFLSDGRAYFAMERAAGEKPAGPLEPRELAQLVDGCCEALSLLHSRGLIHRDLKPDNVRFDPATGRVMLLDLGLACPPGRVRDARGTRGYVAPELLERGSLDARADLYALGALLHECATGRPAFSGEDSQILIDQRAGRFVSVARLRPDLPDALAVEISRLLEPDPSRRPATADEARARLLAALGSTVAPTHVLSAELVGASSPLAALDRAAESASGGEPGRVILSGPAGSGRTRLLEAWQCRLALSARSMLVRRVNAVGAHPLASLREDLALVVDADLGAGAGDIVADAAGDPVADAARDIVADAVDAATLAAAMLATAAWRRQPLVIAFDGCERAPAPWAADLAAFARAVRGPIVVVLATDAATGTFAPRGGDLAVSLAPLSDARCTELAASALRRELPSELRDLVRGGGRHPGDVLRTLEAAGLGRCPEARATERTAPAAEARAAKTRASGTDARAVGANARRLGLAALLAGVPMSPDVLARVAGLAAEPGGETRGALDELLARGSVVVEQGLVFATPALGVDRAFKASGPGEIRDIEDRIVAAWDDIASELPEGEAEALRLDHVAEGSDVVAALGAAAMRALVALREGHLVAAREAARGGLARCDEAPATRERHHAEALLRGVAAAVAERSGHAAQAVAEREMAIECARRSEDPSLKGRALLELARLRREGGDEGAAATLLASALAALEDPRAAGSLGGEILAEAADVELARGNIDNCTLLLARWPGGAADAADAGAGPGAGSDRSAARLALVRARLFAARCDDAAGDAFARAAEALDAAGETREVPAALAECARWRETRGDAQGALEAWSESLAAADVLGDAPAVAHARDALAALHAQAGRPEEAAELARSASRAWANAGDVDARAQSLIAAARHAFRAGHVNAAVGEMQEATRLLDASTPPARRAELLSELGVAQLAAAEHAEALACCEEALALATEAQDLVGQAKACCALGMIHGAFGSTREGVRWSRRALELTEARPGATRARARLELGMLFIREGHLAAAKRAISLALSDSRAADDVATSARACVRLGRVARLTGELAGVASLVEQGLELARSRGDRLTEIKALRELGVLAVELGDWKEGLRLLEESLGLTVTAGWFAELPGAHEALARAHLRLAVRLRTPTGVVADKQRIEIARAHVEKGLDLTVATGRMADRAALLVLSACVSEMQGDARTALDVVNEAHRLALETGDLLVASRARLVRGEALLAAREFGVALAEARIALEAVSLSGAVDDEWRVHALLARIQGAWGMPEREAASTQAASQILRRIAGVLDPARAGAYLADAEKQSALLASGSDAARARRSGATEVVSERLGGRVDTEDLVEALITARRLAEERGMTLERTRERLRRSELRRRVLARASAARAKAGRAEAGVSRRDADRVLGGLARAWGAEAVALVELDARGGGAPRTCATRGEWAQADDAIAAVRSALESGLLEPATGRRRRRSQRAGSDVVVVPLLVESDLVGALVIRTRATSAPVTRADFALLEALSPLLATLVTSPSEVGV